MMVVGGGRGTMTYCMWAALASLFLKQFCPECLFVRVKSGEEIILHKYMVQWKHFQTFLKYADHIP